MIGFRPHLSTQDVLLQLHHDLLDPPTFSDTKALLSLDLHKAFDNVSHLAILTELATMNPGSRTYHYIRSFLTACTAEIIVGDLSSPTYALGSRGTPQGAVLSPFLFNLALRSLPDKLDRIPDHKHTLYADDVTLWVTSGSDGHIEQTLQRATDVVTSVRVALDVM
nr:putative nicotine oxidoreductase [Dermacentor andersoni]